MATGSSGQTLVHAHPSRSVLDRIREILRERLIWRIFQVSSVVGCDFSPPSALSGNPSMPKRPRKGKERRLFRPNEVDFVGTQGGPSATSM